MTYAAPVLHYGTCCSQDVCLLILSINLVNGNVTLFNVLTKVMKLYIEVLGARSDLVYGCDLECTAVVFKDLAMDSRCSGLDVKPLISNLMK